MFKRLMIYIFGADDHKVPNNYDPEHDYNWHPRRPRWGCCLGILMLIGLLAAGVWFAVANVPKVFAVTPRSTPTPTASPTATASPTPSRTPTASPTATASPTPSRTPTGTAAASSTPSVTPSRTATQPTQTPAKIIQVVTVVSTVVSVHQVDRPVVQTVVVTAPPRVVTVVVVVTAPPQIIVVTPVPSETPTTTPAIGADCSAGACLYLPAVLR